MTRYTTILFDLDHTLLDSDASAQAAFDATMRSIGVESTPEVFAVYDDLNQRLWRQVEAGAISPNVVKTLRFEQLLDAIDHRGDPVEMGAVFVGALTANGDLFPGALEVLDDLAGRATLGLVTNGIGPVQRGRLDRLGIADHFDVIAISGELGISKPSPEIFDHAFATLGSHSRSRAVMVGDSLVSDIAGGIAAGIDTVWFNRTGATNESGVVPTHEVSRLDGLRSLAA